MVACPLWAVSDSFLLGAVVAGQLLAASAVFLVQWLGHVQWVLPKA